MPTVPRIRRQVAAAGLPNARLNAAESDAAFGANLQDANARVGQSAANLGDRIAAVGLEVYDTSRRADLADQRAARDKADTVVITKATSTLANDVMALMWDPQTGAMNVQGEAAFPLVGTVDAEFEKRADAIAAGLTTDKQKLAFEKVRQNYGEQTGLNIRRHVSQQQEKVTGQVLGARLESALNMSVANAQDGRIVTDELGKGIAALQELGPQIGLSPEVVQQKVAALTSATQVAVIRKLVAQDRSAEAQARYDAVKGDIAGEAQDEVLGLLKASTTKAGAQQLSDAILKEGGTPEEQRQKAKDRAKTADERDQALGYIEHEQAQAEKRERDAKEDRQRSVYDVLDAGRGTRGIPTATWAQMSGAERSAARSYAKQLAEGTPVKTDLKTLEQLHRAADTDPQGFAKLSLFDLGYAGKLGKEDFEEMLRLQSSIRKGDTKAADEMLTSPRTNDQIWQATTRSAGIDPNSDQAAKLQERFVSNVLREQTLRGKKLNAAEVQQELNRLLVTVVTQPGFLWDTKKKGYELTPDDIPLADRRRIAEALRLEGQLVDPARVLDLWIDEQHSKQAR